MKISGFILSMLFGLCNIAGIITLVNEYFHDSQSKKILVILGFCIFTILTMVSVYSDWTSFEREKKLFRTYIKSDANDNKYINDFQIRDKAIGDYIINFADGTKGLFRVRSIEDLKNSNTKKFANQLRKEIEDKNKKGEKFVGGLAVNFGTRKHPNYKISKMYNNAYEKYEWVSFKEIIS